MDLANAYIIVVLGIMLAKTAGFFRDIVLSGSLGISSGADIYFQVFGIASLVFTAVGSALSTLVIKNINKTEYSSPGAQKSYASYFIRYISTLVLGVTAVMYIFARPIVKLLLPALSPTETDMGVKLMYIMLPSFLFISTAYMMSGLLQNRRVFFITSIMSLPYNLLTIAAALCGIKDIIGISLITTLGWFLHIAVLLPSFYREGYRFFAPKNGLQVGSGWKNTKETVYIFVSGMMFQLCFIIDKAFVNYEPGMVAVTTYASQLFITFSGVFVVALSSVVFPAISQNYEHGEMDYVRSLIGYIIKITMSIFIFYLIAVCFFGEDIIALIYERGEFTREATVKVAEAFVIYSFGIFGYLAQNLLNKVLYLAGRYKMTVAGTVVTVALKIALDVFALPRFGANFAAVTTTALLSLYALFVALCLRKVIGSFITSELLRCGVKIIFSAALSISGIWAALRFAPNGILPQKTAFFVPLLAGCGVYAVSMWLTGVIKELFATPLSKNR